MTKIFYFSATGNSLKVARDIAAEITDTILIPITKSPHPKELGAEGESIGFIFPVYFNGLPMLVKDFLVKISLRPNTYCFAIAVSGGTRSNTLGVVSDILAIKKVKLSFADEIKVQTSYLIAHPIPDQATIEKKVRLAAKKTQEISQKIARRKVKPAKHQAVLWSKFVNKNYLYKNANIWDKNFRSTEKCTHCQICSKVCPVGNIKMIDQLPVWQHHCQKCLACISWCPCAAIEYDKNTIGKKRYRNPAITADDLINRRDVK